MNSQTRLGLHLTRSVTQCSILVNGTKHDEFWPLMNFDGWLGPLRKVTLSLEDEEAYEVILEALLSRRELQPARE